MDSSFILDESKLLGSVENWTCAFYKWRIIWNHVHCFFLELFILFNLYADWICNLKMENNIFVYNNVKFLLIFYFSVVQEIELRVLYKPEIVVEEVFVHTKTGL